MGFEELIKELPKLIKEGRIKCLGCSCVCVFEPKNLEQKIYCYLRDKFITQKEIATINIRQVDVMGFSNLHDKDNLIRESKDRTLCPVCCLLDCKDRGKAKGYLCYKRCYKRCHPTPAQEPSQRAGHDD